MTTVLFFEKPGCGTNARQKLMLEAAGHTVVAKSLLAEPWTEERLMAFFGDLPVAQWFNSASPRIKSGEVDPEKLDAAAGLSLLVADHLLIRRPLVEADGQRCAGFDSEPVTSLLEPLPGHEVVEGCSRPQAGSCPTPESAESPS